MPPNRAIMPNDTLKLAAWAIKPTRGGTSTKPRYPTVEIEASADELLMFFDLPAKLNIIGTTHDTPRPAMIKPSCAVTTNGNRTASDKPPK
jgi:hypothetical protein